MPTRRKCFISYHHADQAYVDAFVKHFDDNHGLFIARQLGSMPEDVINSNDTDYVMRRIRQDYIADSTVTIVLMGKCTWVECTPFSRTGSGLRLRTFGPLPELAWREEAQA